MVSVILPRVIIHLNIFLSHALIINSLTDKTPPAEVLAIDLDPNHEGELVGRSLLPSDDPLVREVVVAIVSVMPGGCLTDQVRE